VSHAFYYNVVVDLIMAHWIHTYIAAGLLACAGTVAYQIHLKPQVQRIDTLEKELAPLRKLAKDKDFRKDLTHLIAQGRNLQPYVDRIKKDDPMTTEGIVSCVFRTYLEDQVRYETADARD